MGTWTWWIRPGPCARASDVAPTVAVVANEITRLRMKELDSNIIVPPGTVARNEFSERRERRQDANRRLRPQLNSDLGLIRSPDGADGSRKCAPDDRLRAIRGLVKRGLVPGFRCAPSGLQV